MKNFSRMLTTALVGLGLLSCANPAPIAPAGQPAFELERQWVEALANPKVIDYSKRLYTNPEVDRLREESPRAAAQRKILALTTTPWSYTTGKLSSAPAYDFNYHRAYWITDAGLLIAKDLTTNTVKTAQMAAGNTFAGTALILSNNGKRLYFCSKEGNFFAIDIFTMANVTGSPIAMGGADANVPVAPPPFLDVLASEPNGSRETIYAVTQSGTLHRFFVDARTPSAVTLSSVQSWALPRFMDATYSDLFRSAPVIVKGKGVIGTWRRHATDDTLHQGNVIYFDTGASTPGNTASTYTTIREVGVPSPIWAPPAIEFNNALAPVYAFVPTGYTVTMVDLPTGATGQTVGLIVNQESPTSGSLFGYPYGESSVSDKSFDPTNTVTVTNDAARLLPTSNAATDTVNIYATKVYDGSDSTPFYAYLKFTIAAADLVVGGTQRSIIDAKFKLRCNSSSNANGGSNPEPLRAFRVSNYLSDGTTLWTNANISPTNRPTFEDGVAFSVTALNSHTAAELLPNAGNAFQNGQRYTWSAKGRVAGAGTYSFGMAHPELPYVNTAPNNGQPFKASAPRFDGGTEPDLVITLSGEGFATPTMENPVAVDSANKRIFVLNTNALYVASYASPTYDGSADPYNPLAFGERKNNFNDPAQTYFALTRLGQDIDGLNAGPLTTTPSMQYVANKTAPLLMPGSKVYVQDNHPGANRTSITSFSVPVGSAPSMLDSATPWTGTSGTYLSYDSPNLRLFASSHDGTTGKAWEYAQ